jgi:adenosylhomocysteine nucleosidase
MKLGIMAAMPEEIHTIHHDINFSSSETHAKRTFYFGKQNGVDLVLVNSRVGKVSAATTATTLIEKYQVDAIFFIGVAGAVEPSVNIGDIILASDAYQHDMDARPIFPRFEVPLTGKSVFATDERFTLITQAAIENFLTNSKNYISEKSFKDFNITKPQLRIGTIATGDQFIKDPLHHEALKVEDETILAVEMEGAAVTQVCEEFEVPLVLVRTISDKADHSAHINFQDFIVEIASRYSSGIIQELLRESCHLKSLK